MRMMRMFIGEGPSTYALLILGPGLSSATHAGDLWVFFITSLGFTHKKGLPHDLRKSTGTSDSKAVGF